MPGKRLLRSSSCRGESRGFTLVELLAVVAITGILGTIGVMLVRKHFQDAKTGEAVVIVQAIRGAQESHRAQNGAYLSCSGAVDAAGEPWYPAAPDGKQRQWIEPTHRDAAAWLLLGVQRQDATQFGFLVHAGNPGAVMKAALTASQPTWPTPTDPWYVIHAAGDRDEDTILSYVVGSSVNGELYIENDGE